MSMNYNPVNTFFQSMNTMQDINRGKLRDKQEAELFDRRMSAYDRAERQERQAEQTAKKRREAAQQIAGLEAGDFGAQDVAKLSPESSFKLGDASDAFDEKKQEEAMRQLWPWFDRVAAGDVVPPEVKPMLLEAGGAMAVQGILSPTVAGLREQAQISPMLKNKIRTLGDQLGPQLLGKKTRVTKEMDPELFDQLTRSFPAVVNGSKAFKDGRGEVAELLIDAEGVDKVQDAKVYAVLEGINPQTGERYRAPMTAKRSGDPDDELSPMRVGGLYAQAEFAEKASRAILAALAGEDDATAEKILQDHWRRAEEYKKEMAARRKNAGVAGVLGNIVGLKADEQKKLIGAVEAGADAKGSVEMILKARPQAKEVDLEWRDNVNVGGQPYQVAYDKKTGKEVVRLPQWNKDVHGKGAAGGGELKSHVYDEFNRALLQAMVSEYGIDDGDFKTDMMGNQKIDVNRYMNKLPPEAKQRFLVAQSRGEGLMVQQGLSPIQAAQQALFAPAKGREPEMLSAHGGQPDAYLPERSEAISAAQQAIASGKDKKAVVERLEKLYPGASKELGSGSNKSKGGRAADNVVVPQPGGSRAAGAEATEPADRPGMRLSERGSLRNIQGQINQNLNPNNPISQAGDKMADTAIAAGKGIFTVATVVPRLIAAGASGAWESFQEWSVSRYSHLKFDEEAVMEFAKKDPEAARKIMTAANSSK